MAISRLEYIERIFNHYTHPHICLVAKDEQTLKDAAAEFFRHQLAEIHLALTFPNEEMINCPTYDFVYFFGPKSKRDKRTGLEIAKDNDKKIVDWALGNKTVLSLALLGDAPSEGEQLGNHKLKLANAPARITYASSSLIFVQRVGGELRFTSVRPALFQSGETIVV